MNKAEAKKALVSKAYDDMSQEEKDAVSVALTGETDRQYDERRRREAGY